MALDRQKVLSIIPQPTLADLLRDQLDIDNDIDYLLHFLAPFFPDLNHGNWDTFEEPTQRLKAAIKTCLKEDSNQYEFIKLYNNSISLKINDFFTNLPRNLTFNQYYTSLSRLVSYYNNQIKYLTLNTLCLDLFTRKLKNLFYSNLIKDTQFISQMEIFLKENLFTEYDLNDVTSLLRLIGLTSQLDQTLIKLSIDKIIKFVTTTCSKKWNISIVNLLNEFVNDQIYPKFSTVLKLKNNTYLYELLKIAHDELVSLRINEIYDMVNQFPHSLHSLHELNQCFQIKFTNSLVDLSEVTGLIDSSITSQAYQREKLVDTFIKNCQINLLHSGANTIEVINMYTKTIKSFLIIDPKGVLLDKVVRQIREYLKTRDDVVIKLVNGLLNNDPNTNELIELAIELRNGERRNSQPEDSVGLDWVPDPIDALPDFKKGKISNIIESLISIFDSRDIFIDEFTKLFGNKLINIHNYDVSEVQDYIDLLKVRFGANEFSMLDVMIKDMSESKDINSLLKHKQGFDFHSSILSHNYWGSVLENINEMDNFKIPNRISQEFEQYSSSYTKLKHGRTLKMVPTLGLVKLKLKAMNNQIKYFEVTPDKASVMLNFNGGVERELNLEQIANNLGMTEYKAAQILQFWVNEGVLIKLGSVYTTDEEIEGDKVDESMHIANNEFNISSDKVLWPYLQSIFENFSSVTLARIGELLTLTVPKTKLDLSSLKEGSIEGYLKWLVQENRLEFLDGLYRLKKN